MSTDTIAQQHPEYPVAGISFTDDSTAMLLAWERDGAPALKLVRRPDNPHDPNAIEIVTVRGDEHIGYLPRDVALGYASLMDEGEQWKIDMVKIARDPSHPGRPGLRVVLAHIDGDETEAPIEHWSPSAAGTFGQCPTRWKFARIDKLPDPTGHQAIIGTMVHAILEDLYGLPTDMRTRRDCQVLMHRAWTHRAEVLGDKDLARLAELAISEHEFIEEVVRAIDGLYAVENPETVKVVAREFAVRMRLRLNDGRDGDGVPFHGFVDRLDMTAQGLQVVDFKTGKLKMPFRGEVPDHWKQMRLYATALRQQGKRVAPTAKLLYVHAREIVEVDVSIEVCERTLAEHIASWRAMLDAKRTDTWPTNTGVLCGWCPFVTECEPGAEKVRQMHAARKMKHTAPALASLGLVAA